MRLTPAERDRLLLFSAAELARGDESHRDLFDLDRTGLRTQRSRLGDGRAGNEHEGGSAGEYSAIFYDSTRLEVLQ